MKKSYPFLIISSAIILLTGCGASSQLYSQLDLTPTGPVIKGLVTLQGQSSYSNVKVEILDTAYKAATDSTGNFSLYNVPAGTYKIAFSKSNYVSKVSTVTLGNSNVEAYNKLSPKTQDISLSSISGRYNGFFAVDETLSFSNRIQTFQTLSGKSSALIGIFVSFMQNSQQNLPASYLSQFQSIISNGSVPFLTWEPWDTGRPVINILSDILSGQYNTYLDSWASTIKDLNSPVIIRLGHEMNGNWYPWSDDATLYKQAFRYVVDRFRSQNVNNVSWMFAPNHNDGGTGRDYKNYFPGAAYVDCLGISGYNFGYSVQFNTVWRSFSTVFKTTCQELNSTYGLPIILDIGCAEGGNDSRGRNKKALWIEDMMTQLSTDSDYQNIKGFCWFQTNKINEADWRINSSVSSLSSFQSAIQASQFLGTPVTMSF